MRKALLFALILFGLDSAFGELHSWKAFYTGTAGVDGFPEFVAVNIVDDDMVGYFDSRTTRFEYKQRWMEENLGQEYEERQTNILRSWIPTFKSNVKIVMERFNQSGGIHTVQMMYGCEWDDDTGTTGAHHQDGYDGEDFLTLDFKTMSYVAPVPQAVPTKDKLNNDRALIESQKNYYNQICIEWLKKYVDYGKETLQRKVRPEVSLLQKDSPSAVSCYATGFFPKSIVINWQKDGKEIHDDVETTELLPNGDGTFQIRSILRVSPEDMKNHQFSCVVEHVSLGETMVKKWAPGSNMLPIIIGCVVVALLAICAVAAFFVWKKKNEGYGKAGTSDTDSENSGQQAAKA